MREIKFRAERFDEIWDVIEWNFEGGVRQDLLLRSKDGIEFRELIKNLTILQFTGLKDKNGKEIYEGDIVIGPDDSAPSVVKFGNYDYEGEGLCGPTTGIGFYLQRNNADDLYTLSNNNSYPYIVLGNIYENSELVEKLNE